MARAMPVGLKTVSLPTPVIIITPTNDTAMASHTGHDGTLPSAAMISATITGDRKTRVVARPEGTYLYAENRVREEAV